MSKVFKNTGKTHWFRNTLIVLVICGILGTIVAAVQFGQNPDRTYASSTIEFSFKGAADGLAPNGKRYDMNGVISEEVLTAALEASDLADRYTTDQISENLIVSGIYPEDIAEKMAKYESLLTESNSFFTASDYHATKYRIVLYNDFDKDISRKDLETLLGNIMTEFRAYFEKTYSVSMSMEETIESMSAYDYPQQLDILRESITRKMSYAQEMADKNADFRYERKSFDDIVVRYNALLTGDLERLSGIVTMNALSKDKDRIIAQYENEIRVLQLRIQEYTEESANIETLIQKYDKDDIIYVSTTGALRKVDSNSTETYDTLVIRKREVETNIADLNKELAQLRMKLADIEGETAQAQTQGVTSETDGTETEETDPALQMEPVSEEEKARQKENVEKGLKALEAKRDAVTEDFAAFLKAYSDQEMNEQTVALTEVKYETPKLLSGTFAKQALKAAGPICALGFIVCMILLIVSRRKEEKNRKV